MMIRLMIRFGFAYVSLCLVRSRVVSLTLLALLALIVFFMPPASRATTSVWSLVPPLVAIIFSLVLRDVVVALGVGVWLGTSMLSDGNVASGFLRLIDTYVRQALADSDHMSIVIFSMLLGGMVGVMSRSGGIHGVVRLLEPLATTPRRTQVVTWLMGVAIFFDDYSNTLIVGNTMRPVTDRHRISREKLAFLVDSTAAPVACIAMVSTWVGYQVSLVGDALVAGGSAANPFSIFLASIPYAFYPIFVLSLTLAIAMTGRDFGPMYRAELRARGGELLAATAQPLADYESSGLAPEPETPRRWINAVVPVLSVVFVTLGGLYFTGKSSLIASEAADLSLSKVIGASDPFTVLLWASLIGLSSAIVLAVVQGILGLREAVASAVVGFKSMLMAVVVLTLAWSLGQVCIDLGTAGFLVSAVGPKVPAMFLPTAVFLVAAAISFATGTSWGTMAILTPLAIPLVLQSSIDMGTLLPATVAAILGGSVFGDHCSPISDTTIMSSMASSCDHVDHVQTQLPYAIFGGIVAIVCGYLPFAMTEVNPFVALAIGVVVVILVVRFVGKPVDS